MMLAALFIGLSTQESADAQIAICYATRGVGCYESCDDLPDPVPIGNRDQICQEQCCSNFDSFGDGACREDESCPPSTPVRFSIQLRCNGGCQVPECSYEECTFDDDCCDAMACVYGGCEHLEEEG
jgi:hypothetical protein